MKEEEIKSVAEKARMIVCGYAFSQMKKDLYVLYIYTHHTMLL